MGTTKSDSRFEPFNYRYPLCSQDDVPEDFRLEQIPFDRDRMEALPALLIYRVLFINYDKPPVIVFQEAPPALGAEWAYYILLPTGGIIKLGTCDLHTRFEVSHVLALDDPEPTPEDRMAGKEFIASFLKEVKRLKRNPQVHISMEAPFDDSANVRHYMLDNLYLSNYTAAKAMAGYAVAHEKEIREEILRYDVLDQTVQDDAKKMEHVDKWKPLAGMFFASSISLFFMALEGFINLVIHTLLKDDLRWGRLRIDERLDLEQKIRLLPHLCSGFGSDQLHTDKKLMERFKKVRDYRNRLFHAKLTDALQTAIIWENPFLYYHTFDQEEKGDFPSKRYMIEAKHVFMVKEVVDDMVRHILDQMEDSTRALFEVDLQREAFPLAKDSESKVRLLDAGKKLG